VVKKKEGAPKEVSSLMPIIPFLFRMCQNRFMFGVLLGLISAAALGANSIITRRGMFRVSPHYVTTITVFTGPIFFFCIAMITGEIFNAAEYSWEAIVYFTSSGISHFALGRSLSYRSIQLIGSTRSNIVTSLSPIVTTVLAMIVLGEMVTLTEVVGILFTLTGPLFILKEQVAPVDLQFKKGSRGKNVDRLSLYKGLFYGVGGAIFWGSSAIFIKLGLEKGCSPIVGIFIAYLSASFAISPSSLLNRKHREEILHGDKASLRLSLLSGLTTNIGQLLRFIALNLGSAIVVSLMLRTVPIWVLVFASLFSRKEESFSRWVFLGNALIMTGTFFIILSQLYN
jgi:drug/metabolite transporter (DMT)-like permease